MAKGKKAATAVAATMMATALVVSSVGGPANNAGDGSFAGSINAIEEAVDNLVDKSIERGMDIEAPSESYTPGINGVIEGLDGMTPTKGTTREVKVSKEGTLYRGDRVRVCQEFTAADQLRFAMGDVKIIATAQSTVGQTSRIAILFTQNGQTKLKTVDMGATGSMYLANTLVILEDEALTAASMVMVQNLCCYIAYNRDGDGVMTAVECRESHLNVLKWTDIWMDGGDPENICLAVEPYYDEAAVCCTRLPQGATQDSEREAVLLDMSLPLFDSTGIENLGVEIVLTAAAQPALYGIDYSKDAYSKGWDMEYVHYWYNEPGNDVCCNSLFITYPTSDEYRRGIIHVRRDRAVVDQEAPMGPSLVEGYQMSQVYGSLPCVDMERVGAQSEQDRVGVAIIHGATKQSEVEGSSATKSRVNLELYTVTRDEDKPFLLWWSQTDSWYNTNVSNVTVGQLGNGLLYISFARDSSVYTSLVEMRGLDCVPGPIVTVGVFGTFVQVEAVVGDWAALVYDTPAGDGYIRVLKADRVVAETDGYHFDGTLLEGGSTGETIRADMTYWPEA